MQVQLNFNTEEESPVFAQGIFKCLSEYYPKQTSEALQGHVGETTEEVPKTRRPRRTAPTAGEGTPFAQEIVETLENASPEPANTEKLTIEMVRAEVDKKIAAGKTKQLRKIFDDFSAENVTSIKKEDYAAVIERVKGIE